MIHNRYQFWRDNLFEIEDQETNPIKNEHKIEIIMYFSIQQFHPQNLYLYKHNPILYSEGLSIIKPLDKLQQMLSHPQSDLIIRNMNNTIAYIGIILNIIDSSQYQYQSSQNPKIIELIAFIWPTILQSQHYHLKQFFFKLCLKIQTLCHIFKIQNLIQHTYQMIDIKIQYLQVFIQFLKQQKNQCNQKIFVNFFSGFIMRLKAFHRDIQNQHQVCNYLQQVLYLLTKYIRKVKKCRSTLLFNDFFHASLINFSVQCRLSTYIESWMQIIIQSNINYAQQCKTILYNFIKPLMSKYSSFMWNINYQSLISSKDFPQYFINSQFKIQKTDQICRLYLSHNQGTIFILKMALSCYNKQSQICDNFFNKINLLSEIKFLFEDERVLKQLTRFYFMSNPQGQLKNFQQILENTEDKQQIFILNVPDQKL